MGNLGSYSRQNKAATALGAMGRIEKTIFVLGSISNEALRSCSVHCLHVFNVFL
nr:transposase [Brevibacillus sp. SKDU10]